MGLSAGTPRNADQRLEGGLGVKAGLRVVAAVFALLVALMCVSCEDNKRCDADADCARDEKCLFVGSDPEASLVCVIPCESDGDCPRGDKCAGIAAPGPALMMIVYYCN